MDESAEQVIVMQKSIETLEPQMKTAAEKVSRQMMDVQSAQEATDEQRELVKQDEIVAAEQSTTASELAEHCKTMMDEVMPTMQEAEAALNSLTPADLNAVRTMKNAPASVKIIMEAVCILKEVKTEKMSASSEEYWTASKKLLNDPKFIDSLLAFEKDAIPDAVIKKLEEKILSNDAFDAEKVKLVSLACECLCKWVLAIVDYDKVAKIIMPKRVELKQAEEVRDASVTVLNAKIEELRLLEENLAELQKQLSMYKERFENLKADHEQCTKRLQRATEIIGCLGGEKERWQLAVGKIQLESRTIVGDVLIVSGIIAYLGQFTESYRINQILTWLTKCQGLGLSCDS